MTEKAPSVGGAANEGSWPCGGKNRWWNHLTASSHYRNAVSSESGESEVVDMCDGKPWLRMVGDKVINPKAVIRDGECFSLITRDAELDVDYYRELYPGAFLD